MATMVTPPTTPITITASRDLVTARISKRCSKVPLLGHSLMRNLYYVLVPETHKYPIIRTSQRFLNG